MTHWHVYELFAELQRSMGRVEGQLRVNTRDLALLKERTRVLERGAEDPTKRYYVLAMLLAAATTTNADPNKLADVIISMISR